MSNPVSPVVRSMVVCEDIKTNPVNTKQVTLVNVLSSIRSIGDPPYPLRYREFCVFVQLTGCRGPGEARIDIREADNDDNVFPTRPKRLQFSNNPLALYGLRYRIRNCKFPRPGLYWVQFWYENNLLAQQPVVLC